MKKTEMEKPGEGFTSFQSVYVLVVCTFLYLVNYMDRQVLAVVLEPMKADLRLTDAQAGGLQTVFLLSMALFSFPAAFLVDRWSRRKALSVMAMVWSVFTLVTGLGRSFWGVLFPRVLVGVGEAGFASGGTAMITAAYPESRRGLVMGIFNMAVPVGSALGMMAGGFLSARAGGWRTPFYLFAVPGIILGIFALFMKDYRTERPAAEGGAAGFFRSAFSLFRVPTLKWLYLGYAMQNVMAFSFLVWAPALVMRARGISEGEAGMAVGVIGLMAVLGAGVGGWLADVWQRRNPRGRMYLPVLCMFLSAALYLLCLHFRLTGPGYLLGLGYGVILVMGLPALGAVTQDVIRPAQKGMAWGMNVFCMYLLGGGWGPAVVGKLSDELGAGPTGLAHALMASAVGGILAGFFYLLAARHYPADKNQASLSPADLHPSSERPLPP